MWIGGRAAKGYAEADFEEVWPRYVSRSDLDALMADRGVNGDEKKAEAGSLGSQGQQTSTEEKQEVTQATGTTDTPSSAERGA